MGMGANNVNVLNYYRTVQSKNVETVCFMYLHKKKKGGKESYSDNQRPPEI